MGDSLKDWIQLAMFGSVIIGWFYSLLKKVEKPDEMADKRISKIEQECPLKHKTIDDAIIFISRGLELIKENHLKHIEGDVSKINEKLAAQGAQMDMIIAMMKDK